jgi:hypothetical protein
MKKKRAPAIGNSLRFTLFQALVLAVHFLQKTKKAQFARSRGTAPIKLQNSSTEAANRKTHRRIQKKM